MLGMLERLGVLALHIPDGFLSVPVSALFWVATVAAVAMAIRKCRSLDDRQVPLLGVMAACIFAAQMLNFPIVGGTSGHLLGGALAAIVLGAWPAILVMACVVALQALLFQDGGILAMGANIFNMGVLTTLAGWAIYRGLIGILGARRWAIVVAGFVAAWLSVMAAALLTSLQLLASGTSAAVVLPAMLGVHALIGIGEGAISSAALAFLLATRPDLLADAPAATSSRRRAGAGVLAGGLLVAAVLALFSPLASAFPDGLERVAEDLGFLELSQDPSYTLLPDYTIPGLDGGVSTILAGLVGVLIVVALGVGIAATVRRGGGAGGLG